MSLDIRPYSDDFLIDQAKLVNEIQKDWLPKPFHQTVKNYRETFSGPNFNPSHNLYAFLDGELVAVINSRLTGAGLMIDPFAREEHRSVLDETYSRLSTDLLQNQSEVKQIIISGGSGWKDRMKFIIDQSFNSLQVQFLSSVVNVSILKTSGLVQDTITVVDYNEDDHYEQLFSLFRTSFGIPDEFIERELREMYKLKSLTISWKVALIDEQIVGHGLLLVDRPNHDYSYLREIILSDPENEGVFTSIYYAMMDALSNFRTEIKSVTLRLRGNENLQRQYYEKLGFTFEEYHMYSSPLVST